MYKVLKSATKKKKKGDNYNMRCFKIKLIKFLEVCPVTSDETNWHHVPSDMMRWEVFNITSVEFLYKVCKLNLIMKKQSNNPNWGTVCKTTVV